MTQNIGNNSQNVPFCQFLFPFVSLFRFANQILTCTFAAIFEDDCYELSMLDLKEGRVYEAKDVDDFFQKMGL